MMKLVRSVSLSSLRKFRLFNGLCAALFALVMFSPAGHAVTVETSVAGGAFGVPFNGTGPVGGGACTFLDCFNIVSDSEVGIRTTFLGTDPNGVFSQAFQFESSPTDTDAGFEVSLIETSEFSAFSISLIGGLVNELITPDLTGGGILNVNFAAALVLGEVYILTISGTLDKLANATAAYTVNVSPVPIPAALPLFGTGLGILGFLGWRRRRKQNAQAAA